MPRYEYKVIPAPKKAGKMKGVKGTDNRFALQLAEVMNQYGADGWEYQRTDTLPCEERVGLTGRTTTYQNMLVFCREIKDLFEEREAEQIMHAPEPVVQFRREPIAEASPHHLPEPDPAPLTPEPVRPPITRAPPLTRDLPHRDVEPEQTQAPAPSFTRVTIANNERPKLSATLTATPNPPEGSAPPVTFRRVRKDEDGDTIAAQ